MPLLINHTQTRRESRRGCGADNVNFQQSGFFETSLVSQKSLTFCPHSLLPDSEDDNIFSTSIPSSLSGFLDINQPEREIQVILPAAARIVCFLKPRCYFSSTTTFLEVVYPFFCFCHVFPFRYIDKWKTLNTSICWLFGSN